MVEQGDIVKIDFSPQRGREQAGYRPAVVISNSKYMKRTGFIIACPITNSDKGFPLHIKLCGGLETTGVVMCDQIKTLDLKVRDYKVVERLPNDLLHNVLLIVRKEIEWLE
ncbi:MAG: mRNA interferase MazF [Acetobacterium sp.]|jgi:mRNA interferase MazF|nr:mRNA interferase MazF [Acetobacterium sp.]